MTKTPSPPSSAVQPAQATLPSPWQCLGGSIVAGGIAIAFYFLTASIAHAFAAKGLPTGNFTSQRIAAAVRTLVVGLSALGTGIFGLAALGLFGLGIQILLQRFKQPVPPADV